jgi:hypothetical protein
MELLSLFIFLTFVPGIAGMFVLGHEAAWKLSSETTGSPKPFTRWTYRYLIFSFWFMFSFVLAGPLTTWHLTKIPAIQALGHEHTRLLFALTVPPALLLYYLHRRFVRWADPDLPPVAVPPVTGRAWG